MVLVLTASTARRLVQANCCRIGLGLSSQLQCNGRINMKQQSARWLATKPSTQVTQSNQQPTSIKHPHIQARLDYKKLIANLDHVIQNAKNRGSDANPALVAQLYAQQTSKLQQVNLLRAERNEIAKQLGQAKQQGFTPEEFAALRQKGASLKQAILQGEQSLEELQTQMNAEALKIPNDTHPDVPVGDEEVSRVLQVHGTKPEFDFEPKHHYDLCMIHRLLDPISGAKVSGSKFVYLCNDAAMLEMALVNYTLQKLRKRKFNILFPPDVAHYKMVEGCGFQPRGEATQIYSIADSELCLTATSEITLASMKSNEIMSTKDLPLRLAGYSHCFRTEIGHGGKQTKGIYRIHQFSKVEMFGFCADAQQADAFFDEMVDFQQEMYNELGLHFQVVDMATGDLGSPAYRKIDMLAYMPGSHKFGEISSTSNCTDYQARRLNIRHKQSKQDATKFVYTLNGTACAVPRLLISILETYQQKDGSILIPKVLQPFMGMQERIDNRS